MKLLAAAVGLSIAWHLIKHLLPGVIILMALVALIRLAIAIHHHTTDDW